MDDDVDLEEMHEPHALIQIRIVTSKGVVFSKIVAENVHNACWWMQENADLVQSLWEKHINESPRIEIEDVIAPPL